MKRDEAMALAQEAVAHLLQARLCMAAALKAEEAAIQQLMRKVQTEHRALLEARRQRDEHKGRAAEYKAYAFKYQRELIAAKAELKKLPRAED